MPGIHSVFGGYSLPQTGRIDFFLHNGTSWGHSTKLGCGTGLNPEWLMALMERKFGRKP
jgi:predicted TPR repeat methyltransferase